MHSIIYFSIFLIIIFNSNSLFYSFNLCHNFSSLAISSPLSLCIQRDAFNEIFHKDMVDLILTYLDYGKYEGLDGIYEEIVNNIKKYGKSPSSEYILTHNLLSDNFFEELTKNHLSINDNNEFLNIMRLTIKWAIYLREKYHDNEIAFTKLYYQTTINFLRKLKTVTMGKFNVFIDNFLQDLEKGLFLECKFCMNLTVSEIFDNLFLLEMKAGLVIAKDLSQNPHKEWLLIRKLCQDRRKTIPALCSTLEKDGLLPSRTFYFSDFSHLNRRTIYNFLNLSSNSLTEDQLLIFARKMEEYGILSFESINKLIRTNIYGWTRRHLWKVIGNKLENNSRLGLILLTNEKREK